MQIWTAADFSYNETLSGESIMSYNNAKCHTLSLNGIKTVANTACRINQQNTYPKTILSANQWLDTSTDLASNYNMYSGVQFFAKMDGVTSTNWLPKLQLIFEYDIEFKQPAYQNRPTSFEIDIVGSKLVTVPDGSTPDEKRTYVCEYYQVDADGNKYHFVREDGEPGTLTYSQSEFWDVYRYRTSGKYFGGRPADYMGPEPRRPRTVPPPITPHHDD